MTGLAERAAKDQEPTMAAAMHPTLRWAPATCRWFEGFFRSHRTLFVYIEFMETIESYAGHIVVNSSSQNSSPIFRFQVSQLWHPSFSPLYDVFNLTTHIFSESLWHVLFTDAPVMTMKKTQANTKTKTKTMTKTKWLKDLACAIFLKMIWLKDIKSDDESVMHHYRCWCANPADAPILLMR